MNLIIDIGNTSIKLAVFNQKNQMMSLLKVDSKNIFEKLQALIQKFTLNYAMISKVGNPIPELNDFLKTNQISVWELSPKLKLPFDMAYQSPDTIGADRLGLAAGAVLKQSHRNQLIIDAGTCVTYDFIDQNNIYRGGAISPGLNLRYKSLHSYTAALPLLHPSEKQVDLIGSDTVSSIQSGVIRGLAQEIEGFIVKYNLNFKPLTVYLTGGDEKLLDRYIKNKIFVSSKFLLLEGLNFILNLNK